MHTVRQFVDRDAPLLQGIVPLAIASSFFFGFSVADKVCQLSPQVTHSVARMKSQGGSIDSFVHGLIKVELAAGRREISNRSIRLSTNTQQASRIHLCPAVSQWVHSSTIDERLSRKISVATGVRSRR
jgi:hypothetical protein